MPRKDHTISFMTGNYMSKGKSQWLNRDVNSEGTVDIITCLGSQCNRQGCISKALGALAELESHTVMLLAES